MRSNLLICAICLVVFVSGCRRSSQQNTNNSAGSGEVSNNLAGERTRAREQLEKGKEFYRNDQDAEAVLAFLEAVRLRLHAGQALHGHDWYQHGRSDHFGARRADARKEPQSYGFGRSLETQDETRPGSNGQARRRGPRLWRWRNRRLGNAQGSMNCCPCLEARDGS